MRRLLFLMVVLLALTGVAHAASLVDLLTNANQSGATNATATGMTSDGKYVSFHTGATATIYLYDRDANASTSIGLGASAGVTYQSGNVVAAGQLTTGGASKYVGGSWTSLPLAASSTAWTAKCIAATSSEILIGGIASGCQVGTGTAKSYQACRYKDSAGTSNLISLPAPTPTWHNSSQLGRTTGSGWNCVSENGIYAASAQYGGVTTSASAGGTTACVGPDTGLSALKYPYGGPTIAAKSYSGGINRTGTRAVGVAWSNTADTLTEAVYWDAPFNSTTVCHAIPMISGTDHMEGKVASDTGDVIAGFNFNAPADAGGKSCWMWDPVNGVRDIPTYATSLGISMAGWNLTDVTGISADGKALCGIGTYNSVTTSWYFAVPEPGSMSALAMGLLGLIGIYRRKK